jgi:hypothetical protein
VDHEWDMPKLLNTKDTWHNIECNNYKDEQEYSYGIVENLTDKQGDRE